MFEELTGVISLTNSVLTVKDFLAPLDTDEIIVRYGTDPVCATVSYFRYGATKPNSYLFFSLIDVQALRDYLYSNGFEETVIQWQTVSPTNMTIRIEAFRRKQE